MLVIRRANKKGLTCTLPLLLVSSLFSFNASANMVVYPMSVGLNPQGEGSVQILSKTNEVQFVNATVYRIDHPGMPDEKEVPIKEGAVDELVVMPRKIVVPGGSDKLVRFVSMAPAEKEKAYRVMFQGVPTFDDANIIDNKKISTEVMVNLVWGVLVFVPPAHPVISLTLSTDKKFLLNTGTQRVKILDLMMCKPNQDKKQCLHKKDNLNIFPDGSYKLPDLTGYQSIQIEYKDWITKNDDKKLLEI